MFLKFFVVWIFCIKRLSVLNNYTNSKESEKTKAFTLRMENETYQSLHARLTSKYEGNSIQGSDENILTSNWRRQCGCIRTSDKLKQILETFPSPPPPSPTGTLQDNRFQTNCISAYCTHDHQLGVPNCEHPVIDTRSQGIIKNTKKSVSNKSWQVVSELVQLVQLSVTATALALYYLIYCYMQLVYYTLRSALYFHNADGPMKITIGVVTVTSLVVGFNLILRLERLIGIFP